MVAGSREVSGKTRVLGILAHPTDHVKAPPAINRIALNRGRDAIMVPMNVAQADLSIFVAGLRSMQSFDGAIITVPHKQAMLPLCDEVSRHANLVGAVNVIRRTEDGRLIGDQLDGTGFVIGLRQAHVSISGLSAYLVGAGGAANAIAFALADGGIKKLTLANRTPEKVEMLRSKLIAAYPAMNVSVGGADPSGHDLIINGTTLGMSASDPLPLDASKLDARMIVAEVIMEPKITPLLAAAQAAGTTIHFGHHMLDNQLQLMANFLGL